MNKPPLRALIVEDSVDGVLLLTLHLQKNYELTHLWVDSADGLHKVLQEREWDVVLSDHTLAKLDLFSALRIVQQHSHDLPFIIVSGNMDEDLAVAVIKAGAHDYLLKANLQRLIPAIERERQAVQARRTQLKSTQHFRAAFNQAAAGIAHIALDGHFFYVNHRLCAITGYTEAEMLARDCQSIIHPDDFPDHLSSMLQLLAGEIPSASGEMRYVRKSGSLLWVNVTETLEKTALGKADYFIAVVEDISARKEAEARYRLNSRMFDNINEAIMVMAANKLIVSVNPAFSS